MADQVDRWQRVGSAIGARMAALGVTMAELVRTSGVSDTTLYGYIGGAPIVRRDKERGLLAALRWPADAFDRIARGEDLTNFGAGGPADALAELVARVEALEAWRASVEGVESLALAAQAEATIDATQSERARAARRAPRRHRPSPEPNE